MGSKDRKSVSELIYSFYRLGHAQKELTVEEKVLTGIFLCNHSSNELLNHFKPEWNEIIGFPLAEKIAVFKRETSILIRSQEVKDIFPWREELSDGIEADLFNQSFLEQPELFLRIRPGKEETVIKKLTNNGIIFKELFNNCIALPNATKLNTIIQADVEAVVQDYSSQRVGNFFEPLTAKGQLPNPAVWDCCAGSGGKSIMAYDLNPKINITVSDIRASILQNLHDRFKKAGITKYHSFISDLSVPHCQLPAVNYQLIFIDVPCSGSGTWLRTPEQLYFFDPVKIKYYSELQKKIVSNVIPTLQAGGQLVYITCSVFKEENELIANFIEQQFRLQLVQMKLLKGYEMKADTMFVAVFEK